MATQNDFVAGPAADEPRSWEEAEAILRSMAGGVLVSPSALADLTGAVDEMDIDASVAATSLRAHPTAPNWGFAHFKSLLESAPDALVIFDSSGVVVLVNAQTERLFGIRREDLLGRAFEVLLPERFRARHAQQRELFFAAPNAHPISSGLELSARARDGREFPVEISLAPLENGDQPLATATIRDISDRKRLEARYRTLVEGIPAVTFMAALDESNNEMYVSPQIEQLLGFSQREWLGDPFLWYRQLHPDDRPRWGAEFARTCSSGVHFSSEYRFLSRDNREVWVHGEARLVRDEHGRPLFLQGIAFDITKSKRSEQVLRQSAEELEQKVRERTVDLEEASLRAESASRARASFLANMSHEIRSPLNGIMGFADLLRRGADTDKAERDEWLEIIYNGGKHLLELISDILDLSKIDAGKLSVELVDCSPTTIVGEVCNLLRSKAEEKGLRLQAIFQGAMPKTIRTDPTRLRQVLMNITGNAIKFTPTGGVRLTTRIERSGSQSPALVVQITDTGIGIAADKLESIFDPFTQADSSITRKYGGTGLGLAISRRLAEQLGGGVTVESVEGEGTTFICEIATGPLSECISHEPTSREIQPNKPALRQKELPKLDQRVLVVDDSETNRKLLRLVLGRAGARIEEAENGLQAVERALTEPFDLILMDMQMPVMDGYTATRELRSRGATVPIIALTANVMKGDATKCIEVGCTGYLSKPIDQALLVQTVAAIASGQTSPPLPKELSAASDESPRGATHEAQRETPNENVAALRGNGQTQAARASSAASPSGKLVSTLPMDDADFREIVQMFAVRLREKLVALWAALAVDDLTTVAAIAHWLKGTGGVAGFMEFAPIAQEMERLARSGNKAGIDDLIRQVEHMAGRIAFE